jgi:RNA polymerase sigma-70 factor (ECF subfamily)
VQTSLNHYLQSATRAELELVLKDLVAQYGGAVSRIAASYEPNNADRADLIQGIWLAVWLGLRQFRGDASLKTWVYRIAQNRSLTHVARRRAPALSLNDDDEPIEIEDQRSPDPQSTTPLDAEALMQAGRRLPLGLREVVVLSLEGLKRPEIAEVLGIGHNNVSVRLNRARAKLKVLLGDSR